MIKPDYAEAYSNLGTLFKHMGKLDFAPESYEKAIEIKPDFAEAYNNLGMAYHFLVLELSIKYFSYGIKLNPYYLNAA